MPVTLGPLETQFLAYAQSRSRPSVATGEFVNALGWTPDQERRVLSRLARKGIIARVRPGLYLVPPRLPPGGRWSPGEFLALTTLMEDCGGRYQISGPNAFYRYGWTEQVPNRLYAYNNRISGDRQVGTVALTLIKVADDRLGGVETVRAPEGVTVAYASKARALVDAVFDWSRFDTLPKAFNWICREVEKDDGFPAEFVRMTADYGNQGTMRRIGGLLERIGVQEALLRRLEVKLRPSSSLIPWNPTRDKRGTTNRRWGVVFNDE
jgi:predicted transcriptional regulator of viral defense system